MLDPWNDQEMASGWSPFLTMQDACAKSPSLRMSPPNERGESSGGSADGDMRWEKVRKTVVSRSENGCACFDVFHENCVRF